MSEIKCGICGKELNSENSLLNHKRDKHGITIKKELAEKKFSNKIIYYFIAIFVIVFIVIAIKYFDNIRTSSCQEKDVRELYIDSHTKTAFHIHPNLEIIINGKREEIPANIGIEGSIMRASHTHDGSGKLHVEPPCVRDLFLGDFFKIWGKEFNSSCIFDNCVIEGKGSLKLSVDGKESTEFKNLVLKDNQRIVIEFNK